MRLVPLAFTALGLSLILTGSAAAASEKVTDVAYLKANRCRGLAAGLSLDTSAFDAFIKTQGYFRPPVIDQMAAEQQDRARREAKSPERAAKAQAELADICQAYRR